MSERVEVFKGCSGMSERVEVFKGCSGMSERVEVLTEEPMEAQASWGEPLMGRLRSGFAESSAIERWEIKMGLLCLIFKKHHLPEEERLEKRVFRYNFPGINRSPGLKLGFRIVRNGVELGDTETGGGNCSQQSLPIPLKDEERKEVCSEGNFKILRNGVELRDTETQSRTCTQQFSLIPIDETKELCYEGNSKREIINGVYCREGRRREFKEGDSTFNIKVM
eukprot:TRINITY_DN4322_c0_g2_i1.p1 TRINITY_DN4322_c0_g2~~TRINITY_DN4322_c0_g2_i1.p1  ORF type:complete len:223 (-),score=58.93 TRINITY_DN4322_c0_g2_i1:195-863(-)